MAHTDLLVSPQSAKNTLKVIDNYDGTATLKGLGIVFDEPGSTNRDLEGDYFTADQTWYGPVATEKGVIQVPSLVNHGFPLDASEKSIELADRVLGTATVTKTQKGWLYELIVKLRDRYVEELVKAADDGKLGLSSTAPPLPALARKAKDGMIDRWVITEMGPTPMPAEPRTFVQPSKSVFSLSNLTDEQAAEFAKCFPFRSFDACVDIAERDMGLDMPAQVCKSWYEKCACGCSGDEGCAEEPKELMRAGENNEDEDEEEVLGIVRQFDSPFPFESFEACVLEFADDPDMDDPEAFCAAWEREAPKVFDIGSDKVGSEEAAKSVLWDEVTHLFDNLGDNDDLDLEPA